LHQDSESYASSASTSGGSSNGCGLDDAAAFAFIEADIAPVFFAEVFVGLA
jgi:hypothetical protein